MEHLCEDMFFAALKDYQSYELFNEVTRAQSDSKYKDYAKYHLALHYKDIKNYKNAYDLFNQVAQSNSRYNDDAKYMLAKCYESGQGVGKDCKRAFGIYLDLLGHYENCDKKYYNKELEDDVKFKLANCYSNGQGRNKYEQKRRARINDSFKKLNDQLSVYNMSKVEILKEACVKIESLTNENKHSSEICRIQSIYSQKLQHQNMRFHSDAFFNWAQKVFNKINNVDDLTPEKTNLIADEIVLEDPYFIFKVFYYLAITKAATLGDSSCLDIDKVEEEFIKEAETLPEDISVIDHSKASVDKSIFGEDNIVTFDQYMRYQIECLEQFINCLENQEKIPISRLRLEQNKYQSHIHF
ncbi:35501_t:CDS:2 [Gigaspora margarita]|uniref:35501_t:CDS:1 n=1 Tax=Gigaspora margarita TaxID=4874 RepID=A0ABM8VVY3_GIGMA|nr:35501_t:CDS:2 [Gigaspora margarita]